MEEKSTAHRTIGKKAGNEEAVTFPLTEVHYNHFQGCHSVDDNNKQRMQPISLEETWKTWSWENRPFAFLLGVSAANSQYAYHYFGRNPTETVLEHRQILAHDLIYNIWCPSDANNRVSPRKRGRTVADDGPITTCFLATLPIYSKFEGADVVKSVSAYPKKKCSKCKKICSYLL